MEESDLFIIDRRGDAKNVQYGTLYRYDIPAHYRFGNGCVIGTPRDVRIDRDASTENQIVLQPSIQSQRERPTRPLASKSKIAEPRDVRLIIPAQVQEGGVDEDYIELRPSLKRKRGSESPESSTESVDYRSIEGKAKTSVGPEDEDMEYVSSSDDARDENGDQKEAREKNSALSDMVKNKPGNIDAWLALVDHQSHLLHSSGNVAISTTSENRTLADIRLTIYERALKSVSRTTKGYDTLVLGRLKEGTTVWERSKLSTKWTEALKDNPTSVRLWTKYLDFVQTNSINFRYETCKAAYVECLRMLHEAYGGTTSQEQAQIASAQIYVLVRFTSFIQDAGYDELAHAVWQILLEYHFFKPPGLSNRTEELESLEAYWESDVPRIGEEGAIGWNKFEFNTSQVSRKSVGDYSIGPNPKVTDQEFTEHESEGIESRFLPAAADDDTDSNDPYRFVMFADLKDIVENLLSDFLHAELISGFLCFMQLPPILGVHAPQTSLQTNQFLSKPNLRLQAIESASLPELTRIARIENETHTPDSMFRSAINCHQLSPAATGFVDRVVQALIFRLPDDDYLAEYHLALRLKFFPDQAAKSAKRLLKARPSSLRLYNAYALIEANLGQLDKAEQVWATALGMSAAWAEEKRRDTILLTHSRMMTLVHYGEENKALTHLVYNQSPRGTSVAGTLDISAAERLKAMQTLDEGFQVMRAAELLEHTALYIDCMAWFSYLVDGSDLPSALSAYEKYFSRLSPTNELIAFELLHQTRASLIRWHIENRRPYKPTVVRNILAESVHLFPANSMLSEVQLVINAQSRIDDRLRDALQTVPGRRADMQLVDKCYEIAKEIRRSSTDGSGATANSVRVSFRNALLDSNSEVKHSPLLWALWFHFERILAKLAKTSPTMLTGSDSGMQRARQVFYDGLRSLPWYKPWVVMGMRHLGSAELEVQQLYHVMTEREMRIRTELEQ